MPIKYTWAWDYYKKGCNNNWSPQEISMSTDIALWNSKDGLSDDERLIIKRNLGFFSTAESLVGNNIVLAIFKHITNAECRQYLIRQIFEEALHTECFHYIVESLNLDQGEIFNAYHEIPCIENKDLFEMKYTSSLDSLDLNITEHKQVLLKNLIAYYIIMEGIFFYSGFSMLLSLKRNNKMIGIGQQFEYILKDESIHLNFGVDLINGIIEENPDSWNDDFKREVVEMVDIAIELEIKYAEECLPANSNVCSLNKDMFIEYVNFIGNRRLKRINIATKNRKQFSNPFPWLSEIMDIPRENNFFERTVTEYQKSSAMDWSDPFFQ